MSSDASSCLHERKTNNDKMDEASECKERAFNWEGKECNLEDAVRAGDNLIDEEERGEEGTCMPKLLRRRGVSRLAAMTVV